MDTTLAERLKLARQAIDISQAELARRVGISAQAIQHIEGGASARTRYLGQIAAALGVDPIWLATGAGAVDRKSSFDLSASGAHEMLDIESEENSPQSDTSVSAQAAFLPIEASYDPKHIPAYVAPPFVFGRQHDTEAEKLISLLMSQLKPISKNPDLKGLRDFIRNGFFVVETNQADDLIPRPYYLNGLVEAYAVQPVLGTPMQPRLRGRETLYVNPHRRPDYGDIVVLWHTSNTFTIGEFSYEGRDRIRLLYYADFRWGFVEIAIPKSAIKAIHAVDGLDFVGFRQTRVSFVRTIESVADLHRLQDAANKT